DADNTATNFVCFLIMNALSFLFFEILFLKFLIALRGHYTSDIGKYRYLENGGWTGEFKEILYVRTDV
ncbi:MAG TPA: hypothetical protein IAA07_09120, partial [Candidatus Lachnoclostridium stercoravium]|nr:hypothetical protein [Candidatus Lachnoclostridium stercoravium]